MEKVLIIDDNKISRKMLNRLIQSFGFETELVDAFEPILEVYENALDRDRFGLVLIDSITSLI